MTDNEKNKLMAEWAGWESNTNEVGTFWNAPNSQGLFRDTLPNLLYDNGAAVGLLDVLVEKGYTFKLLGAVGNFYFEIGPFLLFAPIVTSENKPSISEAICEAILSLIEKERRERVDDNANFTEEVMRLEAENTALKATAAQLARAVITEHVQRVAQNIDCQCFRSDNCNCYDDIPECECVDCAKAREVLDTQTDKS